jgi:hypothetical protein
MPSAPRARRARRARPRWGATRSQR